jgi:ABC-2 type transport system permease protein
MESVRTHKYVLYSLIALPLIFSVVVPAISIYPIIIGGPPDDPSNMPPGIPSENLTPEQAWKLLITWIVNFSLIMFLFIPAIVSTTIATYSFVGEKVNRQLEPLLATPTTDGELLLGKSLGAFLPSIGAIFASFLAFTVIVDSMTFGIFNGLLLPNLQSVVIVFVFAPMIGVMAVEWSVFVSSRVTDVRAANQLGMVAGVPVFAFYFLFLGGIVTLDVSVLIAFFVVLLGLSLAFYYLSKKLFKREEILTKWK